MPISRVRSVTVASMMFMMPIPPTKSEMPAMTTSKTLNPTVAETERVCNGLVDVLRGISVQIGR